MPFKKGLMSFLNEHKVRYTTIPHLHAYTAQELAQTLHVSGDMFAKTVILKVDGNYVMAVLPASYKVNIEDFKKMVHAHNVELADEDDIMTLFPQCEIGAMPPFGNIYDIPTYVDSHLTEDDEICFNSSNLFEAIRLKYKDYENIVQPVIGSFCIHA